MLNLPVPINKYLEYRPVMSFYRQEAHDAINGTALRLALSIENEDSFEELLVEFRKIGREKISDKLTKQWAFEEIDKAEKRYRESNEKRSEEVKLDIFRSIQLARMFLNQGATIDEIIDESIQEAEPGFKLSRVNHFISQLPEDDKAKVSDGYHTFESLYKQRMTWNALAVNLATELGKGDSGKSVRHYDGKLCFGDEQPEWFIVEIMTQDGPATNHYSIKDWDYFKIPERETAKFAFDGHTSDDVCERLLNSPLAT